MYKKKYEEVVKAFDDYYNQYKHLSAGIDLKYDHSYKVAALMEELATLFYMDEEGIFLSKTIGLLHDLGRFEQLKQNNSFNDELLDHADFAVEYLIQRNHIRDFIKDSTYDSVIEKAIRNHNKLKVEEHLTFEETLFSNMIRDMDKTDIFYQVGKFYKNKWDSKPTKEVLESFDKGESVLKSLVKNNTDRVILTLSFLNDYNYQESLNILRKTKNLDFYLDSIDVLKEESMFQEISEKAKIKSKVKTKK